MRVMLLHRNLGFGGAEVLVVEVAVGLARRGHDVLVVTFYDDNPLAVPLVKAGVPLQCLGKRGRWDVFRFLYHFLGSVRRFNPDALYTVMPDPNLVALTARLAKRDLRIIWGVSVAHVDLRLYDYVTKMSYGLEARLARFSDLVISNSAAGVSGAIGRGFPGEIMHVVPNGVDTIRYQPDATARGRVRSEWGVSDDEVLIGLIGRLDPQKDIPSFLAAAAILASENDLRFVVVGNGHPDYKATLIARSEELGIAKRVLWIPARPDIEAVYNAIDLMVISAAFEGTSYALVQAMACGKSAVVTDAGDNGAAVGVWGQVVPPRNAAALAEGVKRQLARLMADPEVIAAGCRRHILDNFSVDQFVAKTEALLISAARIVE